jgi:hypothetical protein
MHTSEYKKMITDFVEWGRENAFCGSSFSGLTVREETDPSHHHGYVYFRQRRPIELSIYQFVLGKFVLRAV